MRGHGVCFKHLYRDVIIEGSYSLALKQGEIAGLPWLDMVWIPVVFYLELKMMDIGLYDQKHWRGYMWCPFGKPGINSLLTRASVFRVPLNPKPQTLKALSPKPQGPKP